MNDGERAGDREVARELFERIGNRPYMEAWKNPGEFMKWREWAGEEIFANKEMAESR